MGIGSILKKQMVQLAPGMPEMDSALFVWACIGDAKTQKIIFELMKINNRTAKKAVWVLCNTTDVLEKETFNAFPEILPIGPLLASNRLGKSMGHFWPEESDCLTWLDKQPPQSVIYVAFGSFTVFDQTQFHELALGLELTNRPFLWVVRPDLTDQDTDNAYPTGFKNRIQGRGRLASWTPQQNVLSHPSIACFLSHCGWNSTMEGLSNGIPFLCWPYFADQFLDQTYICDIWKVGLGFNKNKCGIIEREEIKNKIDQLLSNGKFRARALELKAKIMESVRENGSSGKNFSTVINWIKDQSAANTPAVNDF